MLDSYEILIDKGFMAKEDLFRFGLTETIFANDDRVKAMWFDLKNNLYGNNTVYIRGFGRDPAGTKIYLDFYKFVFNNCKVEQDPTNNAEPTRIMAISTGLKKQKDIRNFQVSHIFGRTKNALAFSAPWNIVYKPKILDPLTGHEATGKIANEYQLLFRTQCMKKFESYIDEFNNIVSSNELQERIKDYVDNCKNQKNYSPKTINNFEKSISYEFSEIKLI